MAPAAVGPDDTVGHVGEHIQGKDPEENGKVFLGHGQGGVGSAEQPQQRLLPEQTASRQQNAQHKEDGDAAAHALVGALVVTPALAKAEVGGGAIPHAPGKGHGQHDQRKDHAGGGVAQVSQLAVSDEDLIHDVVQCADQQGKDAGQGEGEQQLAQLFPPKISVLLQRHKRPPEIPFGGFGLGKTTTKPAERKCVE